ncbi:helix-turn-helix domain-containing protein [Kiloniella antarctica]|uniref:Helix-turn-helix domain-containing protein n=1 Tax=Kiloniella antarctica TaxID=1550907 RepID=A0ABW5BKE4_9PROT
MKDIDIGDVSKATGLTPATLRFYEEKGLIVSSGRNGLRRLFDPSVLQTLSLIMLGQKAGFSLDEIREFSASGREVKFPTQTLLKKADEINQLVKQLAALRDGLRHVVECQAPTHTECPRFNRIMKVALARTNKGATTRIRKGKAI